MITRYIAAHPTDLDQLWYRSSIHEAFTCRIGHFRAEILFAQIRSWGAERVGVRWGELPLVGVAHLTLPVPAGQAHGLAAHAATGPLSPPRKRAERAILVIPSAAAGGEDRDRSAQKSSALYGLCLFSGGFRLLHVSDELQDLDRTGTELLGQLVLQWLRFFDKARFVDVRDEFDTDFFEPRH
jgi:hypothetical protein